MVRLSRQAAKRSRWLLNSPGINATAGRSAIRPFQTDYYQTAPVKSYILED